MSGTQALRACTAAVCVTLAVSGCGGGGIVVPTDSGSPTPGPTPTVVTTVVAQGDSPLSAFTVAPVMFTMDRPGTLDVTVDWTFATNDVDIFLARGSAPCTLETFNDRSCGFVATEESTTMKPERLRTASLAAGTYSLYVANFGERDESVAWQVVHTTGSGAATARATGSRAPAGVKRASLRLADLP